MVCNVEKERKQPLLCCICQFIMILLRNQRILAELIKTNAFFDEINLNSVNLSMIMLIPLYLDESCPIRKESKEN